MRRVLVCLALVFFVFAGTARSQITCPYEPPDSPVEKDWLKVLYCATGGPNWTSRDHWFTSQPLTNWRGITVVNNSVQKVDLSYNNLVGTIPAELKNLTNLELLVLPGNQLTGAIPPELGNLTSLTQLHLYKNQLTGNIPTELGNLTSLTQIRLEGNQLTGNIPSELGNLTELERLYLNDNKLTGAIPAELRKLTNLVQLYLHGNQLSGNIPPELEELTNLWELYLHRNQLSGNIPDKLPPNLYWLVLHGNQLTGPIPAELGSLANLWVLELHGNQLSGNIPPELGKLTELYWLYLNDNKLTGAIPAGLETLTTGANFQLFGFWGNEGLSWSGISDELGKRADRETLRVLLRDNGADGAGGSAWFPSGETDLFSYSSWRGVTTDEATGRVSGLDIRSYGMRGEITNALEALGGLESLKISGNRSLTGTLPLRLMELSNLETLDIRCTGVDVPGDAGFQAWLDEIDFSRGCTSSPQPRPPSSPPPSSPPPSSPPPPEEGEPLSPCPQEDREILGNFYETTGGEHWDENENWNSREPLSQWYGVETDDAGEVISLRLSENNLSGEVPEELLLCLSELKEFALWGNDGLSGEVPEELVLRVERAVLRDIAEMLNINPEWFENYGDPYNFEDWHGGVTTDDDGRVVELDLPGAEVPESVSQLKRLRKIMITSSGGGGCALNPKDNSSAFSLFLLALLVFAALGRKRARG